MNELSPLRADTRIDVAAPKEIMARLREHFREHGTTSGDASDWTISFDIGSAHARIDGGRIAVSVRAGDDTSLAFLQWSVAEHVYEFARGERPQIVWQGGSRPGTRPPYFREMQVVRAVQLTPRMRRITLAGRDLARFARDGLHVRLLLEPRTGVKPVWPIIGTDGRQAWPDGERPASRVYTVRRIDVAAGEIEIDFVLHEGDHMPGACFGREALPGAIVGMTGPGGGTLKPGSSYILAGDETALPAISRMLEEMQTGTVATVLLEVADEGEIQELPAGPGIVVHWLSREGRPAGSTGLLAEALRGVGEEAWRREPCVWAACEHAAAKAIRRHLKSERHVPRDRYSVAAYWRRGVAGE